MKKKLTQLEMGHLVGMDGFEYFRSKSIHCDHCCQVHHRDSSIDYFHRALLSGLIHPSKDLFLPLTQEFIVKQDGSEKEDCERTGAKRWLKKFRTKHPHLPVTILGDDAFCTQPYISDLRSNRRVIVAEKFFRCKCSPLFFSLRLCAFAFNQT